MNRLTLSSDICPVCLEKGRGRIRLTTPEKCSGFHTAENDGRFYQRCALNNFTPQRECNYFYFNDTMQRLYGDTEESADGSQPSQDVFGGLPFPSPLQSLPPPIATTALFVSPTSRPRASRLPCLGPDCRQRGNNHAPQSRHSACVQQFCKGCCRATPMNCPAPRHNMPSQTVLNSVTVVHTPIASTPAVPSSSSSTPTTPTPVPIHPANPYGRMIDPSYALKLTKGDFEVDTTGNPYKNAKARTVEVHWFFKDGEEAELFSVIASHFPLFHPRDSPPIVAFVGEVNTHSYVYWNGSKWMRTDAPVTVKARTPLFLRSHNVTVCLNGPSVSPAKRKLSFSLETPESPSPQRIRRTETPVAGPTQYRIQDNDIIDLTLGGEEDVFLGPKTINSEDGTRPGLSTRRTSPVSSSPKKWPAGRYACDVQQGFAAMVTYPGTVAQKFQHAFKVDFKSATYYENFGNWSAIGEDAQIDAVSKGRTPEGEWHYVLEKYGKSKGKGKGKAAGKA
ncbi:hypothetical protein B0H14DRAFT_325233 [Mycena olivaceomarginata]|nr:hypothetical protein B0H14DRAFT_325233 [Mycena olivaceomarginata]